MKTRSLKVLHLVRGACNKVRSLDLKELLVDTFFLMRSQIYRGATQSYALKTSSTA